MLLWLLRKILRGHKRCQSSLWKYSGTQIVKRVAAPGDCGFVQLNGLPYIPSLVCGDYLLLQNLKKCLRGHQFSSNNESKSAVSGWFERQHKRYLLFKNLLFDCKTEKLDQPHRGRISWENEHILLIWAFHSCDYEECCLLGCYVMCLL
jgi:hypothetical protein